MTRARRIPHRARWRRWCRTRGTGSIARCAFRPARVLASHVEDDWDSTRTAWLPGVDHLLARVGDRLERLRQLAEMNRDANDFSDDTKGSFRRTRRLCVSGGGPWWAMRWGKCSHARSTCFNASRPNSRRSSTLRSSPRATWDVVPVALRSTNILVNDPHYRKVAALWRTWSRRPRGATHSSGSAGGPARSSPPLRCS